MSLEQDSRMYKGPIEPVATQDLTVYRERGPVSQAFLYDMTEIADSESIRLRLNPALESNPHRERILVEIEVALDAFEQIRQGELNEFIDCVGMQDDGEASRIGVDAENVDNSEAYLRRRLSWLCPDLIQLGGEAKGL